MTSSDALLQPLRLKHLTLKNRIMSTAHAPAYAEDGMPRERYQLYHEEKAKGGIGADHVRRLVLGRRRTARAPSEPDLRQPTIDHPVLQEFSDRIHRHGAALMMPAHPYGPADRWDTGDWLPPISSSPLREPAAPLLPQGDGGLGHRPHHRATIARRRAALQGGRARRLRDLCSSVT